MPSSSTQYRGRFAPSPSGPLHLGSLIAALASYLDARSAGGRWLVRMEDLDPPREEAGAADGILHSLQCHGLRWDEPVLYQSSRASAYAAGLATLKAADKLFYCDCSRAMLGPDGACRSHCRQRQNTISTPYSTPYSTRVIVPAKCAIAFTDQLQGPQHQRLDKTAPDFVVKRKDGLDAYQLAVVIDDASQGITHIVRGCDLLDATPRQIFLQRTLGYHTPHYCHLPVITAANGQKFSKQNHAPPVGNDRATHNLRLALQFLNQASPPAESNVEQLLAFATSHWAANKIPARATVPASEIGLMV